MLRNRQKVRCLKQYHYQAIGRVRDGQVDRMITTQKTLEEGKVYTTAGDERNGEVLIAELKIPVPVSHLKPL